MALPFFSMLPNPAPFLTYKLPSPIFLQIFFYKVW